MKFVSTNNTYNYASTQHLPHFKNVKRMAEHITAETLVQHAVLRDRYIALEKTINEMRHEHNTFLAKYI